MLEGFSGSRFLCEVLLNAGSAQKNIIDHFKFHIESTVKSIHILKSPEDEGTDVCGALKSWGKRNKKS